MRLFAALVPPPDAARQVRDVVARVVPEPPRVVSVGPPGKHRIGRRREEPVVVPSPPPVMLDPVPAEAMHLPIAKFGNLALGDATRLANALDQEARTWETPRLSMSGGLALEPEGDFSVWAKLAGDVDALSTLTRGVVRVAQALHLFVDRRGFRPHVRVGTITQETTEDYLEEVLAALDAFEGHAWWMTTISLLVPTDLGPGQPPFRTFRDIPLGPGVSH